MSNMLFMILAIFGLLQVVNPASLHNELYDELQDMIKRDERKTRMEERAGLFEGDIEIDKSTERALTSGKLSERDAINKPIYQWPNGVLYYMFDHGLENSFKRKIHKAMKHLSYHTCIRFKRVRHPEHAEHYVKFVRGRGCSSRVGRDPYHKEQTISLGYGCERLGTIVHEIKHSLGFFHEQSRLDRERYIDIRWINIKPGHAHNFRKYPRDLGTSLGKPYDYHSLMHYSKYAFSMNDDPTIVPTNKKALIGQRFGLSHWDAYEINKLYGCKREMLLYDKADPFVCGYQMRKRRGRCPGKMRRLCMRTCLKGRFKSLLSLLLKKKSRQGEHGGKNM